MAPSHQPTCCARLSPKAPSPPHSTPSCARSSYKNKGVQQVLGRSRDYLPPPLTLRQLRPWMRTVTRSASVRLRTDEPFSALAFKVINDAYGALTFVRVYSGVLTKGASVQNSTRGKREKIGRMVEMFAKEANPIEEARAGDIIALVSLAETETGDTLCDSANPVVLERMRFPTRSSVCRSNRRSRPSRRSSTRPSKDGACRSLAAPGDGP